MPAFAIRDSKKMMWGKRKVLKAALEVLLPFWAWMDMGLRGPVLLVVVKT
jgi:hypothetical protein